MWLLILACAAPKHVAPPMDADGDGYDRTVDCDDARAAVHPGATEVCDPEHLDEDCDGRADDADDRVEGAWTWRPDVDGDGYAADDAPTQTQCEAPEGYVASGGDCDDLDASVFPGEGCGG